MRKMYCGALTWFERCVRPGININININTIAIYMYMYTSSECCEHRTELLDDAVRAPRQLERDVHASTLVVGASVGLQTDARAGRLRDDRHELLSVHEALLLRQVQDLERHVLLRARLVAHLSVFVAHDARLATGHLGHALGSAQLVDEVVECVRREPLAQTLDLEKKFCSQLARLLRVVRSERQRWQRSCTYTNSCQLTMVTSTKWTCDSTALTLVFLQSLLEEELVELLVEVFVGAARLLPLLPALLLALPLLLLLPFLLRLFLLWFLHFLFPLQPWI